MVGFGHRRMLHEMFRRPIESWDDLRRWMDYHLEMQRAFQFMRGCPIGTASYSLQPSQEEARRELLAIFVEMRRRVASFLRRERRAGRLSADARPAQLADFTVAVIQGALILGVLERQAGPVRRSFDAAMEHLRSFVE